MDRDALLALYLEGLSYAEIGRRFGRSRERVRQVVSKLVRVNKQWRQASKRRAEVATQNHNQTQSGL